MDEILEGQKMAVIELLRTIYQSSEDSWDDAVACNRPAILVNLMSISNDALQAMRVLSPEVDAF
jgi:hypothetical protein